MLVLIPNLTNEVATYISRVINCTSREIVSGFAKKVLH